MLQKGKERRAEAGVQSRGECQRSEEEERGREGKRNEKKRRREGREAGLSDWSRRWANSFAPSAQAGAEFIVGAGAGGVVAVSSGGADERKWVPRRRGRSPSRLVELSTTSMRHAACGEEQAREAGGRWDRPWACEARWCSGASSSAGVCVLCRRVWSRVGVSHRLTAEVVDEVRGAASAMVLRPSRAHDRGLEEGLAGSATGLTLKCV